ncbi:MAG: hypothetical protein QXK07_01135 [Desulfurococcaceae archaeon]
MVFAHFRLLREKANKRPKTLSKEIYVDFFKRLLWLNLIIIAFASSIHSSSDASMLNVWTQNYYILNETGLIMIKLKGSDLSSINISVKVHKGLSPGFNVIVENVTNIALDVNLEYRILQIRIMGESSEKLCLTVFLNISAIGTQGLVDQEIVLTTVCRTDPLILTNEKIEDLVSRISYINVSLVHVNGSLQDLKLLVKNINNTMNEFINVTDTKLMHLNNSLSNLNSLIENINISLVHVNGSLQDLNSLIKNHTTENLHYKIESLHDQVSRHLRMLYINIALVGLVALILITYLVGFRKMRGRDRDVEEVELMGL